MTKDFKQRRASLLSVIQALDETDAIADESVELDTLDEAIPEELGTEDLGPVEDEAEETPAEAPAEDSFEVAGDEVTLPDDKDEDAILGDDEADDLAFLDDEEDTPVLDDEEAVTASEEAPGVEDEITDTATGGDPTVSEIAPGGEGVEVQTDGEVFPTDSEYVAKITARLDRVADILEKRGMKRMAFRIDRLSDQLEASLNK